MNNAFAAVTVTAATGGGAISADTNTANGTATWTTLTGPTIAEGAFRDFPGTGTFILSAPSGFSFNTGAAVTATITRTAGTGSCFAFTSTTATPAAGTVTFTLNAQDGNPNTTRCKVVFSNIQVRPTAGTPLATGNVTKSGTATVSGITNGTTNLGTLTEIAGAKNQLVYTTQPSAIATTSVNFSTDPVIHLEDQYGNTETSDSASTIGLAPVLSTQACGGTAGSGTITSTPASGAAVASGVMTYTAMQYSAAQSIKICATSSGVTSALSSAITVNSPPAPTITSLSATSAIAGTSAFTLTVNGANYVASSTVDWNGSARTTTFVSATQLTAAINAADIASVGTSSITVANPAASGGTSSGQTFTVSAMPSSLIVFKSATSTSLNGASTTITVNKPTGVVQGDTEVAMISYRPNTETLTAPTGWVLENNQTNSFDDADGMATYVLLAGASEPSSYTWTLSSGSTGSAGAIEDFSGVSPTTPVNAVSSTAPLDNSYIQNAPSVTSTVSGAMVVTGYSDANADSWNGVFDMIQDVDAASAVVPNDVGESLSVNHVVQAAAGATGVNTATVSSLSDASDAGQAVTLALQPGHAVPTTVSISPTSTTAGGAQFTLTVNGTGFDSSSVVDINGSPRTTTFVSYTQVTAVITAADVAAAGTASITVVNPAPGGGTSNAQTLTILNPVPTAASISPTSTTAGGNSFTITVTGTNFTASSTMDFNGVALVTTFVSSSSITATIPASDIAVGGTDSITVVNPTPGGGTSGAQTLTVKNPIPTTTSISPTSTTAGGTSFTMTINGTNFDASSTADFNGSPRTTTFVSSTTLTTTITAADVAAAGTASITVVNPAPGGGTSNAQTFTINNPVPTTSTISPTSTTAGGSSFVLTVTGTNFSASSTIDFNGTPLVTTFISGSSISATIPAADIAVGGTDSITVVNPTPGGGTSNAQTLTVKNPAPTLTSISPTSTTAGSTGFTLTLTGTNFIASSSVQWNGSARTTTFVSSTTLTAVILTSDLTTPTTSAITVVNPTPGGGTSGSQTFTVNKASTSIAVTSSASSSVYGSSVTFTATVTPAAGGPPTGSVTFKDGAVTLGAGVLNGATPGVATFSTSSLSVSGSPHSITAIYGGDSNFASSTSSALSQAITAKALTVTGITASNKIYDASTTATLIGMPGTLVGVVLGDTVSLAGTAVGTFTTSSVGTGITVTVSGQSLAGAQAGNYSLIEPTTTANITAKNLTVSGITAANKPYDGTTSVALNTSGATLTGVVLGDSVTLNTASAVGAFATSSVGTGITVTVSGLTISGAQASNYTLTQPTTTANITAKNLTVSGITASNKTYDASTTATLVGAPGTLVGVISGDSVSLSGTALGTFATSSVGNGITVAVSGQSLTGAQASNYSLTEPTTTANITSKSLTVTGITANNKTYDGSTTATLNTGSAVLVGVIAGDAATLNTAGAMGTFATSSVGTGIAVTISGLTISGSSANNYSLTQPTTTANILSPTPVLSSLSPTSTTAGGVGFTLTANGSSFTASSTIYWNGIALVTTFSSSTQIMAVIPAGDIATAGTSSVTVVTPAPGGGTSSAQTFTINNPVPTIATISPTSTAAGGSSFTLTVNGTNFVAGSIIDFNGSPLATSFVSSTQLTATVPAIDITTAATDSITVVNSTPGGGTSNVQSLIVNEEPTSLAVTSSATSFVYGSSVTFTATVTPAAGGPPTGSVAFQDGVTTLGTGTLNGATPGVATFSTSTLSVSGSPHSITAVYGGDSNFASSTSSVLSQTITAKPLTVTGITASNKTYDGTTSATLNTTGAALVGVVPGDAVTLNTAGAMGTFATSSVGTGITVTVSSLTISGAQASNYTLTQPTTTADITNAAPVLTSISPASSTAGSSQFTLTAAGSDFSASSVVDWNGVPLVTTFVSAGEITAVVPATDIATAGIVPVTVVTPAPGGGTSSPQTFTVTTPQNPTPALTALSSTSTTAGSAGFLLTLTGAGFISTSQVQWDGFNRTTNFISSTTLTANILASDLATGGSLPVTVVNPTPGGGTSNVETFTINNPVPTSDSLNPTSTSAGSSDFTLTVSGTNFVSGSVVEWNGSSRATTFVSSSTLTAMITAADVTTVGTSSVTVVNPTPGGGTSNAQTFTVTTAINSVPTTSSLNPTSTSAGSTGFVLTVNGANFVTSSTVDFNGAPETTTFISSNQLTATIPAVDVETGGLASVVVVNPLPGGGTSNAQTFTILNPAPATTLLDPSSIGAGSSDFTLTVSGTNFVSASVVDWNGSSRATTFISSSTLTATITAADVTTVGTSSITVVNPTPGGGTSNAQIFAVTTAINPAPTIVSINPTSATAGGSGLTLTVSGTNFVSGSVVDWNGSSRATTFVSSSTLTAAITAADIATVGTSSVAVVNPTPGGGTSGSVIFTINAPVSGPGAIKFVFANVTSSAIVGNNVAFNIEAINASGTIDTSFEQGVTLTVGGSGTGGGLVTIINGVGTSTVSDNIAQAVALGLQDSQSTGLDVSAAANITFVPGAVSQFTLSHPGNMNVDTRLGYTVGREDQFGNPVSASSTVAYLYSNSTSTNAAFFDAPTGGTPVTSTIIADGSTSTVFWYYDDSSGSRTVTASDNPVAPDGAAGIADASDTFMVTPGAVKFIFANIPASATAGDTVTGNVYAVDSSNNIYPSYAAGVTVTVSGSATGGGLVNIVNGVGTTTITDLVGETVTIGLRDTQGTGLGVGATVNIVFNPKPVVSTSVSTSSTTSVLGGGGGPSSAAVAPGIKPGITITFSGMAYPGASVSVIRKDLGLQAIPTIQATPVAADGSFLMQLNGVTRLSGQTYLLSFTDRNGLVSQTKAYNIPAQDKLVYGNILAAPTLGFENSSVVTKGQPLVITGYATPKATVELFVDGAAAGTVVVNDPSGKYTYPLDTDSLGFGRHAVWAIQKYAEGAVEVLGYENPFSENEIFVNDATNGALLTKNASGTYTAFIPAQTAGTNGGAVPVTIGATYTKQAESDFSNQQSFTISPLQNPKLDLNGDGVIDIKDLSIFLSYLKTLNAGLTNFHIVDPTIVKVLDFNGDGVVDVNDLNILMAAISQQQ